MFLSIFLTHTSLSIVLEIICTYDHIQVLAIADLNLCKILSFDTKYKEYDVAYNECAL